MAPRRGHPRSSRPPAAQRYELFLKLRLAFLLTHPRWSQSTDPERGLFIDLSVLALSDQREFLKSGHDERQLADMAPGRKPKRVRATLDRMASGPDPLIGLLPDPETGRLRVRVFGIRLWHPALDWHEERVEYAAWREAHRDGPVRESDKVEWGPTGSWAGTPGAPGSTSDTPGGLGTQADPAGSTADTEGRERRSPGPSGTRSDTGGPSATSSDTGGPTGTRSDTGGPSGTSSDTGGRTGKTSGAKSGNSPADPPDVDVDADEDVPPPAPPGPARSAPGPPPPPPPPPGCQAPRPAAVDRRDRERDLARAFAREQVHELTATWPEPVGGKATLARETALASLVDDPERILEAVRRVNGDLLRGKPIAHRWQLLTARLGLGPGGSTDTPTARTKGGVR